VGHWQPAPTVQPHVGPDDGAIFFFFRFLDVNLVPARPDHTFRKPEKIATCIIGHLIPFQINALKLKLIVQHEENLTPHLRLR
jgi:hypothetical protein